MSLFKKLEQQHNEKVKIAVYGESDAGKTYYSLSGIKNALLIDIEHGFKSANDTDGVMIASAREKIFDADGVEYTVPEKFALFLGELEDSVADGTFDFETIVVDSYSMYSQELFAALDSDGKAYAEKIALNHKRIMDLPCNIIIIYQDGSVKHEDGYMKKAPSVIGNSFKKSIPYFYDIVIRIFNVDGERHKSWSGSETQVAKNRLQNKLDKGAEEFDTAQELIEYIAQNV